MDNTNLDNIILALLFSADEPLSVRKIAGILEDIPAIEIKNSIQNWKTMIDDEAWSIKIEKVAGGYQMSSRPEYAQYIAKLYSGKRKMRLSKAALESLAIVAYKQPITRAGIETVRGVNCGGVISNLMERGLIKISGKAKVLGSPFLYDTTQDFLEYLGLDSLRDLPSVEELEAMLEHEENARREHDEQEEITAAATSEFDDSLLTGGERTQPVPPEEQDDASTEDDSQGTPIPTVEFGDRDE
jgi:segregation and condensation protein B